MIRFLRRLRGMSCQDVTEVLQHYLDRELDEGVTHRVSVHLDDCRHCEFEYTTYRDIKATLAERAAEPLDPAVLLALRQYCEHLTGSGGEQPR